MPTKILLEAIARKNCVEAVYNRSAVKLAPHILYTRHGEIYLDAVTMAREGKPPREVKIGSFKVTGLSEVALAPDGFRTQPVFEPEPERYEIGRASCRERVCQYV